MKLFFINFLVFFICQLMKLIFFFIKDKKINLKEFFSDGGMPSAHAAVSSSITTLLYLDSGSESRVFILSLIFTLIVVNDSLKVRRDVGIQAQAINKMMETIEIEMDKKIRERNGHKFIEVLAGIVLGISASIIFFKLIK